MNKTTFVSALIMHGFKVIVNDEFIVKLQKGEGSPFFSSREDFTEIKIMCYKKSGVKRAYIEISNNPGHSIYMNFKTAYEHLTSGENKYVY